MKKIKMITYILCMLALAIGIVIFIDKTEEEKQHVRNEILEDAMIMINYLTEVEKGLKDDTIILIHPYEISDKHNEMVGLLNSYNDYERNDAEELVLGRIANGLIAFTDVILGLMDYDYIYDYDGWLDSLPEFYESMERIHSLEFHEYYNKRK